MFKAMSLYRAAQIILAGISFYLVFMGYAFSFRVPGISWELSLNANAAQWGLSLLGGLSLGVSGAAMLTQKSLLNHVRYFSVLMFAAIVFFLSDWWAGSIVFASVLGLFSLLVWNYVFLRCLRQRAAQNVMSVLLLVSAFLASVLVYGFVSAEQPPMTSVLAWLFGDLKVVAIQGVKSMIAMTFLVVVLSALVCVDRYRELVAPVLLGLGVGMLGAVFFVSAVAPIAVKKLRITKSPYYYLYSGLLASAMVVVATHFPKLFVGGYSPSLLITNAVLLMPLVVYLQIAQKTDSPKSKTLKAMEWLILLIFSVLTVSIVWHLGQFAQGLI